MDTITIALFQMNIKWEDPNYNILQIENELNKTDKKLDLFILPEMFSTGFSMTAQPLAWHYNHPMYIKMQELAMGNSCSIMGSVWFKDKGQFYNRCFLWAKNGDVEFYDKVHLFSLAEENKFISSGKVQKIFTVKGWKIKPQICYDLRFPKDSYNEYKNPYDLLVYVANWPEKRILAWENLLTARAIENQSLTIGVNRVGTEPKKINYTGKSIVLNYDGEPISDIPKNKEGVFIFTLSKNDQNKFRNRFPFIKDA